MATIEEADVPTPDAVASLQGMIRHIDHAREVLQWAADFAESDEEARALLRAKFLLNVKRERLAEGSRRSIRCF
jgi:hypothetical protein